MKPGSERSTSIVTISDGNAGFARAWRPSIGPETTDLLSELKMDKESKRQLVEEATQILSHCVSPATLEGEKTGLVVGYVQSGKTASFTTVSALARDNGYALVIVIAGTSIPLLRQSVSRIKQDLRLESRVDRPWQHFENPTSTMGDDSIIRHTLEEWLDPVVPIEQRKTVLIAVMKHHSHIASLTSILENTNLDRLSAVIVDDEADQASLNTAVNSQDESTTYRRLLELRSAVPHHTFLQYTATPQAPLLINIIDTLSPDFVELLTPGDDYIGGQELFEENGELVRIIHAAELPSNTNVLVRPPETLVEAMMYFIIGVAVGYMEDAGSGNRSMMVHPSFKTDEHGTYLHWVTQIREMWLRTLTLSDSDPDKNDLLDSFQEIYDGLRRTVADLPEWSTIVPQLARAARNTIITLVNATQGQTPTINWRNAFPHILVGGQAMDRGFTVEGLTVTYMPRGLGIGAADTLQQRGRFFGYKKSYLGYCRIYLGNEVVRAYRQYAEHEDLLRKQLRTHFENGRSLNDWKRAFFLDQRLRPTRSSVQSLDYMRFNFADEWTWIRAPHQSPVAVEWNRNVLTQFLDSLSLELDVEHEHRTDIQRHSVSKHVLLEEILSVLTNLRLQKLEDSLTFTSLLLLLSACVEVEPGALATVYRMSEGRKRERSVKPNGEILNLFQGRDRVGDAYPGDRQIKSEDEITLQVHRLRLKAQETNEILEDDVYSVAIWVPARYAKSLLIQV